MHRWKLSALAAAAFVSAALSSTDAAALALGPISVHSALGENLRADIAIAQITPAEMDSLLANIASPEIFRAQGMDYSAAARSIAIEVKRNTDGTARLQLSSNTPITDPFLDLVLQTNWHSGNLVRSYTLLLDPPASTRPTAAPITPAQVAAPANPASAPAAVTGRTYSSNAAAGAPAVARPPVVARTPAPVVAKPAAAPASGPAQSTAESVTIRAGQTASQVANANRAPGVSLDQMLVAMLRSNPGAFIHGNVNRIRAGTVVQMPSREQAMETSAPEARRIVAAQSRDFNTYRRSLASKAPTAAVQAADRSSSGQVQALVQDTNAATASPDKLTLSKAAAQNAAQIEHKLAEQKQAIDQSERLNELQRNLTELNQLAQNSAAPTPAVAESPATETAAPPATQVPGNVAPAAPAVEVAVPALAAPAETPVAVTETPVAVTETPAAPAPATPAEADPASVEQPPAAAAAPAPAVAAAQVAKPASPTFIPAPAAKPTLWEQLQENPLIPAGTAALALLLGLLGYRTWKKRTAAAAVQDPVLGDSQLQSDSFFGGSGGQQVDTNSADGATTMAYSPSQLDGGGDVDPVAEADVYLAYGRDVQAEEILKEALRNYPQRLAVHMKLAEIYAKRQDVKALENTARTLQGLASSDSADWQRVVTMGRSLDPNNPLYALADNAEPSYKPTTSFADALQNAKPLAPSAAVAAVAAGTASALPPGLPDIDLNLDLDLPGGLADQQPVAAAPGHQTMVTSLPSDEEFAALEPSHSMDAQLDLSEPSPLENPPTLVADTVMPEDITLDASNANGLDFDLSNFNMDEAALTSAPAGTQSPEQVTPTAPADDVFDLGADLRFDMAPTIPAEALPEEPASPATPAATPPNPTPDPAEIGLDFDLSALDMEPASEASAAEAAQSGQNGAQDALTTKLDLAQEFNAIGDSEGARALIEEVLAEASGAQKARAQKMLSDID